MSATDEFARPVPTPTALSAPHWDGCRRHELCYQRCDECAQAVFPPAATCWRCSGTTLSWRRSTGTGSVYSHSTVWRPQTPAFEVPYVVAVVAVDEGWHLFTNIVGCPPGEVHVGMRVAVRYIDVGDVGDGEGTDGTGGIRDTVLPAFAPLGPEED